MGEIILNLDSRVYRLSAVKKAAYRFGDRCSVAIDLLPEGAIQVRLTAKSERAGVAALEGEFLNEVLDQDLREAIAEETEGVRRLLLAQAFSGLSLTDSTTDTADYREDPLGISRSQVGKS